MKNLNTSVKGAEAIYSGFNRSKKKEPIPAEQPPKKPPISSPDNMHIMFPKCSLVLSIGVGMGTDTREAAHTAAASRPAMVILFRDSRSFNDIPPFLSFEKV
jgi:hypothetical protein